MDWAIIAIAGDRITFGPDLRGMLLSFDATPDQAEKLGQELIASAQHARTLPPLEEASTMTEQSTPPQWYEWATLAMGLFDEVIPMLEGLVGHLGNQPAHAAQLANVREAHAALTAAMPAAAVEASPQSPIEQSPEAAPAAEYPSAPHHALEPEK